MIRLNNNNSGLQRLVTVKPSIPCKISAALALSYNCAGYKLERATASDSHAQGNRPTEEFPRGGSRSVPILTGAVDGGANFTLGVPIIVSVSDCSPCVETAVERC